MEFGKTKFELRLGFFVLVGLIILVTFVLLIGDFKTWGMVYRVNFIFTNVNGVRIGAPIRFAGVDAGEIESMQIVPRPELQTSEIKIVGLVRNNVQIPPDSVIWISTLGLLGEKYIDIIPGKDYTHSVKNDETLRGTDPIALNEVTEVIKGMADDLRSLVTKVQNGEGTVGRLFNDDTLYKEIEGLVEDIRQNPWKLFWKPKGKK
ncbi:MAG: MlaD family protein [Candidatus Omnitrophota bacterium]|jgi:phospholipid/cholesterol/gamma-HCH transport system substrate-binding protein